MESVSISDLISSLKTSFKASEYDAVAKVLVQRDEQKQQIIEALKRDAETRANEKPPAASIQRDENEQLKKENQRLQQQNDVLFAENQTLQQQDEALCACMKELERRIAELEKGIESFKKDMVRAHEKDGGRQNSTFKLRTVLELDDSVHSSAAKKINIKEKEAIPGEVVEIVDSDNECVVPNKGNQSAKTNTEKRVQRGSSDLFIDLSHDYDIAVRKKIRRENSTDVGDLHISSRRSLNDSGVHEKCQMLNVNESVSSLIKSPVVRLSQSTYSSSDSQKTKINPRDASSVRKGKLWNFEGELAADLTRNDLLCMEAVCALHKHRISVEKSLKDTSGPKLDQLREATSLAEFLTNGDPDQRLKKRERHWITKCRAIVVEFSKELFELYRKHEVLFASKS